MKPKSIITFVLFAFIAFSLGYSVYKEQKSDNETPDERPVNDLKSTIKDPTKTVKIGEKNKINTTQSLHHKKVVVYYFYTNKRCSTCIQMEELSEAAIKEGFSEELKTGKVLWNIINTDEPENRHFLKEFNLFTKSLIIISKNGEKIEKWKNCEKIWDYVGEPPKFINYVKKEVNEYLKDI